MTANRPTYLNEGWTSRGLARKKWALENEKCAYCGGPLPKGRRLYCSRECSWKFIEDPRYHRRLLLWTRIRAEVLWEHKTCQICGVNPSSEVDHIQEIARGGDPFIKSNLQAVCSLCHRRKTTRFLSGRTTRRSSPNSKLLGSLSKDQKPLHASRKIAVPEERPIEEF